MPVMHKMALFLVALMIMTSCSPKETPAPGNRAVAMEYYTCPMHPQIHSDRSGICPICQMDLVKRTNQEQKVEQTVENRIRLSNAKQLVANVVTEVVQTEPILVQRQAHGYMEIPEPNQKLVSARFNGRIEKLYADRVGFRMMMGQPLFQIYSPDLMQAQTDYLLAIHKAETEKNEEWLQPLQKRLLLMGLTDEQLAELRKGKTPSLLTTIQAPVTGTIMEKSVLEGQYINEGNVLYKVANLAQLWFMAGIYEQDLGLVKKGGRVRIQLDAFPESVREGVIDFIYPVIDPQTRTVQLRAVLTNPDGILLPNMYGIMSFAKEMGQGILVSQTAVLFTGKRNLIWVKRDSSYLPRSVKVGVKVDNRYQIIEGLQPGEEVVVNGTYLIDSESQLQNPSALALQGEEDAPQKKNMASSSTKPWNSVCPVMGNEVDPEGKTVFYKGKYYGFCCPGCIETFRADPEQYAKRLSSDGQRIIE